MLIVRGASQMVQHGGHFTDNYMKIAQVPPTLLAPFIIMAGNFIQLALLVWLLDTPVFTAGQWIRLVNIASLHMPPIPTCFIASIWFFSPHFLCVQLKKESLCMCSHVFMS